MLICSGPLVSRGGLLLAFALTAACLTWPTGTRAQAVRDPRLSWYTVESAHFQIHYHEPLGVLARRVARVAEASHAQIAQILDYRPPQRTHIVLTDDTDSANGSATAIPFNNIRLYATAPEDLSPLSDYDDWISTLVHHEHTHVLHLDQWSGVASIVNALLGKVYAPNHIAPRWFLEGLATFLESETTAGGRMRSTQFDMYLRMDAVEGRLVTLAQMSNTIDRWPHGNVWYLYGSQFLEYIAQVHGRDALARIVRGYGGQVIPYGLNRVCREATGQTFTELYDAFLQHVHDRYRAQAAHISSRGLREGLRITSHGEDARTPRFLPDGRILYWASDGRSRGGFRILDTRESAWTADGPPPQSSRILDVAGQGAASPTADGEAFFYSSIETTRDIYGFYELGHFDLRTGRTLRLTHGARAQEPDVSPDGRTLVYSQGGSGTSHLMIASVEDVERSARVLSRSARYNQIYAPRWSPDGESVAFSAWEEGGFRDIFVIDVATGARTRVTNDRALDAGPTWSPDGRFLYFSSDRSGVANLYAWSVADHGLKQVTNVVAGAYQPTVSSDGRRIAYIGYTTFGFDVFVMELDESNWSDALPYVDTRPAVRDPDAQAIAELESRPYNPLETLRPFSYLLDLGTDAWGSELGISTAGGDVVGFHDYRGRVGVSLGHPHANVDLGYTYNGLPLRLSLGLARTVAQRGGLEVGGQRRPWVEDRLSFEFRAGYVLPSALESHSIGFSVGGAYNDKAEPFGGTLDPNEPFPRLPTRGFDIVYNAGWTYSNQGRFTYDISPSFGTLMVINASLNEPVFGSRERFFTLAWGIHHSIHLGSQHVLAMRYGGGAAFGDPARAVFGVGGLPDVNLVDAFRRSIVLGGIALRGYPPGFRGGMQAHLAQVEWRFPIWRPQWGLDTLPFYVNRVYASVFADCGGAFTDRVQASDIKVGVGLDLYLDLTLAYYLSYTVRLGVARGLMDGGITQFYAHLGLPF